MMEIEDYITDVLNRIAKDKQLGGEFAVIKNWEQGPFPIQRCHVISVYFLKEGKTILVHRERLCSSNPNDKEMYHAVYIGLMAYFITNWDEIWSLISTKPQ